MTVLTVAMAPRPVLTLGIIETETNKFRLTDGGDVRVDDDGDIRVTD